jgi:DNA mismatch repair protein MutS2
VEATKGGIIARTHAEEVLELPKILKSLSNFCSTEPGKTRAENISPMNDQLAVECELEKVQVVQRSGESADFFAPFGPGYLRDRVQSAGHISIDELVQVRKFLGSTSALKARSAHGRLKDFFAALHEFRNLMQEIDKRIDEAGAIRDDASPRLAQIRAQKRQINRRLREVLNAMLRDSPGMFTDLNIVERSGHFVLPVRNNFKKQVKGIIHSFSNSGETVFIEPMAVSEDAAHLAELEESERIEIESILHALTEMLRDNIDGIEDDIDRIVTLDVLFAKVRFANELGANRPTFDQSLSMVNAFHPVLRHINDQVVPLNLRLNSGKRVLLISGPNAGGKTVVLKTVGLVALMAKCGLFIPADEGSSLPFFDEIYADIGDEQSIESQLSTFAAHIKQIKTALEGRSNSLVLLDELMSQTSVEEGSALASAILDELSRTERVVLATTHNENLKIFVGNRDDMLNGGMEYSDRPTYRLILGVPQPSNAIRLARTLGISQTVLDNATVQLDEKKVSVNKLFEDLSRELKRVEEERKKLSSLASDYEGKLAAFNVKKKQEFDALRSNYRNELTKAKRDVERLIKTLRKDGPRPDSVRKARDFFESKLSDKVSAEAYHPGVGELVRIRELRRIGQVVAEKQGKYKISLQNIYYWVEPTDIESIKEDKGNQN